MNNSIIKGSLGAIAQANNKSIAETFLSCDVVVIVDTSGSMSDQDSRGGRSRYEVACEELANLQNSLPGKIGVLSFSDSVQFCPDGKPFFYGSGTNLAGALRFAKIADIPGMRFIVISDGYPDDPQGALDVARTYKNRIDVIYVGPETSTSGRDYMAQLAKISGGTAITADRAQELAAGVQLLLSGG